MQGIERQCREKEREREREKYNKIKKNVKKASKGDGFREVKEVMPCHVQRCNFKAYNCHGKEKE